MIHRLGARTVSLLAAAAAVICCGCSTPRAPVIEPEAGTGAASSPKSSTVTIKDENGKSMAELFQGKFAGVKVSEVPGGGIRVRIRNAGGLNGSGDPLYIVNGVPMETPDGTLFIDPNDIAKIEVVDVGSLALYGIRGANGVVKITTKK